MAKRGITAILHQCPRSGADAQVLQKGVELDQVEREVLESIAANMEREEGIVVIIRRCGEGPRKSRILSMFRSFV
jgi:hypothetical protein